MVQREQIEGWAKLHGHAVGEIFEELDQSGARADRPLLLEAIGRQESGAAQVLVVAKLDRFGRSLVDGLQAIERVAEAGGSVVSVSDGLDFSTDTGKLVLRLMLSLAEWELDRVRTTWAVAQAHAIERGVHMGTVPMGYRRKADGRLTVDPRTGPLVTEMFHRRAGGEGGTRLAHWLTEQGVPTHTGGSDWSAATVHSMLRRRVYLGEVSHGPHSKADAHEPLIDVATWRAAQLPLGQGTRHQDTEPALLRGLLRCAGCGRILTTRVDSRGTQHEGRQYHCFARSSRGACPEPANIRDSVVEPYLEAVMWGQVARGAHRGRDRRLRQDEQRLAERERELADYRDNLRAQATLGASRFADGLAVRTRRLEQARTRVAAARDAAPGSRPAAQLRRDWPALDIEARRGAIATVIDCAFVTRSRDPDQRIWVFPSGTEPANLPPLGPNVMPLPRSFTPQKSHACAIPPPSALAWTRAQVREALAPLLDGRDGWPAFRLFQEEGLAVAHMNLRRLGTERRWASDLGLTYETKATPMPGWTEERVRGELAIVLEGRETWPTQGEFAALGKGPLRTAAAKFATPQSWAAEFEVSISEHARRCSERWTSQRINVALKGFTAGRSDWPSRQEFNAAGLHGLYDAINRQGKRHEHALRLGLQPPVGKSHRRPGRWTQATIDAALQPLLAGRSTWPPRKVFVAAGLGGMYQAVMKTEGHTACARRHGLPRMRAAPRRRTADAS